MIVDYGLHGEIMLQSCSRMNDEDDYLQAILLVHLSLNQPSTSSIGGLNIGVDNSIKFPLYVAINIGP